MGRGQRGRGGRGGGRRGGPRGGGGRAPAGYVLAPSGDTSLVTLRADLEFFEKLADKACPAAVIHGPDGVQLKLDTWKDLPALLAWFVEGLVADPEAELSFSPKLNKQQRALVHTGVEGVPQGELESVSRGVGDQRFVTVLKKGRAEAARAPLSEKEEHKAYWLWRWAQQGGFEVSRDEVAEMVHGNSLKPDLQELWATKSAQQKALQQLCGAAAGGDLDAIRATVAGNPRLLAEGVFDLHTGVGPLHMATRNGQLDAMRLLLELGAGLEWRDGAGLTALQISRKFDQSDAEGLLLRAGAKDPDAANWPGGAPAPALQAAAPAGAAAAAAAAEPVEPPGGAAPAPVAAAAPAAAPAPAAADGGVSSPRSAAAVAAAKPPNGVLQPQPGPRSVAASEGGESESAVDSAASVCGTDMSRNVGDVSSIAGDSLADGLSEAAVSPRASLLGLPLAGSALEVVGEQPDESEEEGEGEGKGEGGAQGEGEGGEESSRGGSPTSAARRGRLLGDYLAHSSNRRAEQDADLESTRSVCGSEMTYQQSLDMDRAALENPSASLAAAAAAAKAPATVSKAPAAEAPAAAAEEEAPSPAEPPAEAAAAAAAEAGGSKGTLPAAAAPAVVAAAAARPHEKRKAEVWAVTGRPEVDAVITEWGEWAAEHKGTVLAGVGVVAGLLLLLGGGRRRVA